MEWIMTGMKEKDNKVDAEQIQALRERVQQRTLSEEDTTLMVKLLDYLLRLLHTIEEAKISIHRLKTLIFGKGTRKNIKKTVPKADENSVNDSGTPIQKQKKGHGRKPVSSYTLTRTVECKNKHRPGERCPQCGRGTSDSGDAVNLIT